MTFEKPTFFLMKKALAQKVLFLLISGVEEEILKHVIMTSPYLITKSHKKSYLLPTGPLSGRFYMLGGMLMGFAHLP